MNKVFPKSKGATGFESIRYDKCIRGTRNDLNDVHCHHANDQNEVNNGATADSKGRKGDSCKHSGNYLSDSIDHNQSSMTGTIIFSLDSYLFASTPSNSIFDVQPRGRSYAGTISQ